MSSNSFANMSWDQDESSIMFNGQNSGKSGRDARRASTPLAQSTPHKDSPYARHPEGKETRRPLSSPRDTSAKSVFAALGEGPYSPGQPASSPGTGRESAPNDEEVLYLRDQVKMLLDRERTSERIIATNEEQIHHLEALLTQNRAELSQTNRAIGELRNSYTAAESNVHMLERDLESSNTNLKSWQQKETKAKADLNLRLAETEKLRFLCQERSHQIDDLRDKIKAAEDSRNNVRQVTQVPVRDTHKLTCFSQWNAERNNFLERIASLEAQDGKLTETEARLSTALQSCSDWEAQVKRLKFDMEEIKRASVRAAKRESQSWQRESEGQSGHGDAKVVTLDGTTTTNNHEGRKSAQTVSREVQTTQSGDLQPSRAAEHAMESLRARAQARGEDEVINAAAQEEAMKQHYATLSNELGLQRNLIDKMIKMKAAGVKKKANGGGNKSRPAAQVTTTTAAITPMTTTTTKTTGYGWRVWPLLAGLFALVFVLLGYMLAAMTGWSSATNAPGVSYAELASWDRANGIAYALDHHGVMGGSSTGGMNHRWWEGGWLWVEMAGYWLEERLQDRPWPS